MSAFIVDRSHIEYLVSAAQSRRIVTIGPLSWAWNIDREAGTYERATLTCLDFERASEVGQMLWEENRKSVRARYPNGPIRELPGHPVGPYIYKHRHNHFLTFDPVQVLKACDCYEYQSCEHLEWERSEAKAFIDNLRACAIHALPGYDSARWEITGNDGLSFIRRSAHEIN